MNQSERGEENASQDQNEAAMFKPRSPMGGDTMQRQATLDYRHSQPLGSRYGPKTAWALDGAGPATNLH